MTYTEKIEKEILEPEKPEEEYDYYLEQLKIGDHYTDGIRTAKERYGDARTRAAILEGLYFIIEDCEKRNEQLQDFIEETEKKGGEEAKKMIGIYLTKIGVCDAEIKQAKRFRAFIEKGKNITYKGVHLSAG